MCQSRIMPCAHQLHSKPKKNQEIIDTTGKDLLLGASECDIGLGPRVVAVAEDGVICGSAMIEVRVRIVRLAGVLESLKDRV